MLVHVPNASTDVPDDEKYLIEWDEWSEVEKGRGPKASWSGEVWSTLSGEISRFSMATPGESTMIKNGRCVNVKNVKDITTDDDEYIPFSNYAVYFCIKSKSPNQDTIRRSWKQTFQCNGFTTCGQSRD